MRYADPLPVVLLAYAAASLLHHVHNAEFLGQYPQMPLWISSALVYAAWLATTAIGVAGYVLLRGRRQRAGLALLVLYSVLGLDGLTHYVLAPPGAHTLMMNATIWLEAATAALLLVTVLSTSQSYKRENQSRRW